MYAYCFYFEYLKNKNEYEHILNNNFELEKHMKNISSLILENLDDIKDLIKNSDYNREYIEQILIMLPSCYFLKAECENIIINCIDLCKHLELQNSRKRLLLFLYSLQQDQEIDFKEFKSNKSEYNNTRNDNIENELIFEADFLNALKKSDIKLFEELIKKYNEYLNITNNEMISTINEIKLKIIYSYYEIGGLYYSESEKNRDKAKNCLIEAKKNLYEAKKLSKKINNYFVLDRINIDLFLVLKKISEIDKKNEYSFDLLDEVIYRKVYQN